MPAPALLLRRTLLVVLTGLALPALLGLPFLLAALGSGDLRWQDPPDSRASALAEAAYDPSLGLDEQVRAALERRGLPAADLHCGQRVSSAGQVPCVGAVAGWDRVVVNLFGDRLVVVGTSGPAGPAGDLSPPP